MTSCQSSYHVRIYFLRHDAIKSVCFVGKRIKGVRRNGTACFVARLFNKNKRCVNQKTGVVCGNNATEKRVALFPQPLLLQWTHDLWQKAAISRINKFI